MAAFLTLKYYHPVLNIGMHDIKNVWLLQSPPVQLQPVLHRGALYYRLPISGKRISYQQLKKGLVKQTIQLALPYYPLPF